VGALVDRRATPAAVALWLPRGPAATLLASGYAAMAAALAVQAPLRLRHRRSLAAAEVAALTALASPAVAASALLAERGGYRLLGFKLDVLALTVAHFHYAGFAAALIAGLLCHAEPGSWPARVAALAVPGGIGLVFVGYFTGDWVELAGAVVLTLGLWVVGLLTWRDLRTRAGDRLVRGLLAASAATLVATTLLALDWALGEATGLPHLSLGWMAATHGVGNALGFALCGILAWRRLCASGTISARPPRPSPATPSSAH
jgi:hypothetical protein